MTTLCAAPAADARGSAFLELLPGVQAALSGAFARFRPEQQEDALWEALAHCYVAFTRLWARDRHHQATASTLAKYAAAHWRAGRRVGSPLNANEILSPYAQRRRGFQVQSLDGLEDGEGSWRMALLADRRSSVPDQAAFRIDFPGWLRQLTPRNRRIAVALGRGELTQDVSRRFRLSPGRVSQLRRELQRSWEQFHGPRAEVAPEE